MAESENDAQTDATPEEAQATSSTKRPAKKRPVKKAAKKPAKKPRAKKKDDEEGDDEDKKTSRRPSKKRVSKKSARTPKAEGTGGEGRTVISRRPSKKRAAQGVTPSQAAPQVESKEDKTPQSVATPLTDDGKSSGESADASMQWGRRAKKSGPIGWDEQQGASKGGRSKPSSAESESKSLPQTPKPSENVTQPAPVQAVEPQVAQESQSSEAKPASSSATSEGTPEQATERSAESTATQSSGTSGSDTRRESSEQDSRSRGRNNNRGRNTSRGRRGRGRNDDNRNRNEEPRNRQDDNRGRNDDTRARNDEQKGQEREKQPVEASSLMELLAESWTEEKTREYLNDGILTRLSPGLVIGNGETIDDAEVIKEPLKAIRRVLADECMVADDVADIMLLDVVMGALADRIEVCRLQASSQSLRDMDLLLDMRCKADKRLMEAVTALKNA